MSIFDATFPIQYFGAHPDRPSPSTRGQVDRCLFLEDFGHMDSNAQAITYDHIIHRYCSHRISCIGGDTALVVVFQCCSRVLFLSEYCVDRG